MRNSELTDRSLTSHQRYAVSIAHRFGMAWPMVRLEANIRGACDAARLESAVQAVYGRNPALRARLVFERGEPTLLGETDGEIIRIATGDHETSRAAYQRALAKERAWGDALCRVVICPIASSQCLLGIHASAIVLDANGAKAWLEQVAQEYDSLGERANPVKSTAAPGTRGDADLDSLFEGAAWFEETERVRAVWPAELGTSVPESLRSQARAIFPVDDFREPLARRAREYDVSVRCLFLHGLRAALSDALSSGSLSLFVASCDSGPSDTIGSPVHRYAPVDLTDAREVDGPGALREVARALARSDGRAAEYNAGDVRNLGGLQRRDFDGSVSFEQWTARPLSLGGAALSVVGLEVTTMPFALRTILRDFPGGMSLELRSDTGAISAERLEALGHAVRRSFERLLGSDWRAPARDVGQRPAVLRGRQTAPADLSVHSVFFDRAQKEPDAVAVVEGSQLVSYAALSRWALAVAHGLRAAGVGAKDVVAIYLDNGGASLASMLGTMAIGAAFLPLDFGSLSHWTRRSLLDAKVSHVITAAAHASRFAAIHALPIERLLETKVAPDAPAFGSVDVADTAYVIYTSGSTGTPRGVAVSHRSLYNYAQWAARTYRLPEGTGVVWHSSIAFDMSVTSTLVPLMTGQRVLPVRRADVTTGLADVIRKAHDLTMLKLTPSHFRALSTSLKADDWGRLRTIVLGGEAVTSDLVRRVVVHATTTRIFNEYGPTEATVACSAHLIAGDDLSSPRIPIGAPIDNCTLIVADEDGAPVKFGSDGELIIAGTPVAKGYLTPASTGRAPFELRRVDGVPTPSYRTGDIVRLREDGALEFLGRRDDEVKYNGYRIACDEISIAIRALPGVADAWTTVSGRDREPVLVAYVVPSDASLRGAPDRAGAFESTLREALRDKLPSYMVPARLPLVPRIPRKSNGKVDDESLAQSAVRLLSPAAASSPPRTEQERALCNIYQTVLGVAEVGIDDNYFSLGGDSIRSVRIAGRATAAGMRLSVTDVQTHPTVRGLVEVLGARAVEGMPDSEAFSLVSAEDRARLPEDVEDAYPLNLLQEGMIYHRSFAPRSAVYHAILSLRLRAPFNLSAMQSTVRSLVTRHPLLRTQFDLTTYSTPLQLVHTRFDEPLQYEDLSGKTAREQAEAKWIWIQNEKQRGFEVSGYPLIRFMLHKLADDQLQLTFSYHHEIVDGWSEALMVSEVLGEYMQRLAGLEPGALATKVTFRDAVALEREALRSEEHAKFWREYLDGATYMRLPRFRPLRADKGERAIIKRLVPVSPEMSDGIRSLSRALSVPVKTLLLASHFRVMSYFGGAPDVVTHTVSNGRPESDDGSQLIGLFVNSLTLRATLPGGTWRELVADLLRREQETLPYRRYPMAEVKRHQGSEPLSETLFIFTDYHIYDGLQQWPNLELESLFVYGESTFPFCAGFRLHPLTGAVELQLEYDSLQFSELSMDSVAFAFQQALRSMTRSLDERYDAIGLLAEGEQERLREMGGRVGDSPATSPLVHEIIESHARAQPDRIAAVDVSTGLSLSYGALDARSERIARRLRQRQIGPDAIVLVFMDTGPDALVAILGILKAGAAFCALDPQHGTANVERAVRAFGVRYALTQQPTALVDVDGLRVLSMNDDEPAQNGPPHARPRCLPDHLAYIAFTSGSTAGPKAVAVSHRALVGSTRPREQFYGDEYERFLLLSSHAFDSAFAGIFGTLFHGGTLLMGGRETRHDLGAISTALSSYAATHALCIPSLWASVVETSPASAFASLRSVAVAGESCGRSTYDLHVGRVPWAAFVNEYGPTETTVWATAWSSRAENLQADDAPTIGRPIDGVLVEVLDSHRAPTPVGVPGDLYILGPTLARGYLENPRETARTFVPSRGGRRMYRTGDVARFDASGNLCFLGRGDGQVKVNGFRVQPAEVESVLETHPAVERAIVVIGGEPGRGAHLVAFVTQRSSASITPADLVAFAKKHLPKYMVPARVGVLPAFPLTKAGKVDIKALRAPPAASSTTESTAGKPTTRTEQALIEIWREVLETPDIDTDSDFFELGGDSLRAMRVLARVAKVFGRAIPVQELMGQASTIRGLGDRIEALSG